MKANPCGFTVLTAIEKLKRNQQTQGAYGMQDMLFLYMTQLEGVSQH